MTYRYDDFTADTLYFTRKNEEDITEILFLLHQLQFMYRLANGLRAEVFSIIDRSTLLPKSVNTKLIKMIETIKKEYEELLELVSQKKNEKIPLQFHLAEFLKLD